MLSTLTLVTFFTLALIPSLDENQQSALASYSHSNKPTFQLYALVRLNNTWLSYIPSGFMVSNILIVSNNDGGVTIPPITKQSNLVIRLTSNTIINLISTEIDSIEVLII